MTAEGGTLADGSYYLSADMTLQNNITIKEGNVTLCLNGYMLTGSGGSSYSAVPIDADSGDNDYHAEYPFAVYLNADTEQLPDYSVHADDITYGGKIEPAVSNNLYNVEVAYSYLSGEQVVIGLPTDAGSYTVTATFAAYADGANKMYYPAAEVEFTVGIAKKDIADATVTLGKALSYDGTEQTQTVASVIVDGLNVTFDVSGNVQTNAGDYTLTVAGNGNFTGTATASWGIAKATYDMSGVVFTDATYTYDGSERTLVISGTLPDGVTVAYTTNAQTNAGTLEVTASFTGDAANYNEIADMTATLTIEKATPAYTIPEELTAIAGQTLSELSLPEGWSWVEGSFVLNEAGEYTMQAVYTPDDTDNYDAVTVEISVSVQQEANHTIQYVIWGCVAGIVVIGAVIGCIIVARVKKRRAKAEK